jgi:hypothetical protein
MQLFIMLAMPLPPIIFPPIMPPPCIFMPGFLAPGAALLLLPIPPFLQPRQHGQLIITPAMPLSPIMVPDFLLPAGALAAGGITCPCIPVPAVMAGFDATAPLLVPSTACALPN